MEECRRGLLDELRRDELYTDELWSDELWSDELRLDELRDVHGHLVHLGAVVLLNVAQDPARNKRRTNAHNNWSSTAQSRAGS